MNVLLHGGHQHSDPLAPAASLELVVTFGLGVLLAVILLQLVLDRYFAG